MALITKQATLGCKGCYYEDSDDCPMEKKLDFTQHVVLKQEDFVCTQDGNQIIYVEE